MFYLSALKRARKERADTLCKALHVGRDNTREYVAMCVNMEGTSSSKRRRKEVRQRKECYTRNTTHLFNDRFSKCNATRNDGLSAIFFAN